ncbi:MAG: YifB family Mg chelatase-like AAA ATPase [Lachnospiraceae bacterium]|nr:YifB family Mg chelatase-like AAA ATPase [Lachnospiraceae bacterium]
MYQKTYSTSLKGLSGSLLEIECSITGGLPQFSLIGLSTQAAAASRERIRSALKQLGHSFPASHISVNIHACDVRSTDISESVSWLDLPIALCILACQGMIPREPLGSGVWLGELSLAGELQPLYGALTMARSLISHDWSGVQKEGETPLLFLPAVNAPEAALCSGIRALGLTSLAQAVDVACRRTDLSPAEPLRRVSRELPSLFDKVSGQGIGKRVITLAAAGMHNLLMIGPPGCGKTMLAQTLPALLPELTYEEQIQVTEIYSCRQMLEDPDTLVSNRPFRAPHHSISMPALIGGGRIPMPGEVSLAHRGVLFLDEFPELTRMSLESLREPLESHQVKISRVHSSYTFPADFLLLAGMNPCPCGYYPDKTKCHCREKAVRDYYGKIDSPLLDRMDLILRMESVKAGDIDRSVGLTQQEAVAMVKRAHDIQKERFNSAAVFNSRMDAEDISRFCPLSSEDKKFLTGAVDHFGLSMRAYHKVLRVARTIADMEGSGEIRRPHLLEALQYRVTRFTPEE